MNTTSVTIGIPTLNGPDRLDRCLGSIIECTDFRRFPNATVIVSDDASLKENLYANDAIIQRLRSRIPGLELLVQSERKGIATNWNQLTRHRSAEIVALLNDDIEVANDWLDVLVYSLTKNPNIGMVSLNQLVSVTKGQLAAIHPELPAHARRPRVDYREARLLHGNGGLVASQGSIFAFRSADFHAVGGFDERYKCFFEECDFGMRLRRKLKRLHCIADYPRCFHMGGATTSDPKNLDAKTEIERSRSIFLATWGQSLRELSNEFSLEARATGIFENLNEWNSTLTTFSS